jgi:chromosome segregation ATPase
VTLSKWASLVTITAVVAYGIVSEFTMKPTDPSTAKIHKTEDSLSATRPSFDSLLASSTAERDSASRAIAASAKRELASRVRAEDAKRSADSLAVLAAATDTTMSQWRKAYAARDSEATELRVQLGEAHQQIAKLASDTASLKRDNLALAERIAAIDHLNADLHVALEKATECRIVGPLRCPSRTQTAIGTLLVDELLHVARR